MPTKPKNYPTIKDVLHLMNKGYEIVTLWGNDKDIPTDTYLSKQDKKSIKIDNSTPIRLMSLKVLHLQSHNQDKTTFILISTHQFNLLNKIINDAKLSSTSALKS